MAKVHRNEEGIKMQNTMVKGDKSAEIILPPVTYWPWLQSE